MTGKTQLLLLVALPVFAAGLSGCRRQESLSPARSQNALVAASKKDGPIPDLDLRVDLLRKPLGRVQVGRNIFEYRVRAAPPPAPVVAAAPAAPVAPPPPPAPLRFYGFAEESGQKKVFLTDGEEIYIASEGDTLLRRYRIARVGAASLELEDLVGKRRWVIPLEQP